LGIKGVDSSFKIAPGRKMFKTKHYWAKVRARQDPRTGESYIDVLVGRKGKTTPHAHLGMNLDQSIATRGASVNP